MKTIFHSTIVAVTLLFAVPVLAADYIAVNVDNANVRKSPSLSAPVIMELFRGYPLKVLKSKDGWYEVEDFEEDRGWISGKIVDSRQTTIVNAKNSLNMRKEPNTKSKVVASVERGVVLDVLKKEGKWTKVKHSSGTEGWIFAPLLWP